MNPQPKILCGVVVSAGKMMRAVKVRTAKQTYNSFLKKVCLPPPLCCLCLSLELPLLTLIPQLTIPLQYFLTHNSYLVSDPNDSLRIGDVVKITDEKRVSRHIKHVVTEIVAPWGPAIEERPKVLSAEERYEKWRIRKETKNLRKAARLSAEVQGENDGASVEAGEVREKVAVTAR